jgi:hypothetical protein
VASENYLDRVVESERQLIDLYEPLLEILRTHGEEHHVRPNPQREVVYWQVRPLLLEEDGELRIVTIRSVPTPPDRDLNNPLRRVEFFERRDLQIDIEGPQGLRSRLIVGNWGEGAVLYVFDGETGRQAPLTFRLFDYYRKLIAGLADTLEHA